MKKKRSNTRLVVERETLKTLTASSLIAVFGGEITRTTKTGAEGETCPPVCTSVTNQGC